ncbi:MAG TPA: nuclear transport factor 2 family protein [Vicinamibacteria bacterium]|nr:nuclear transport factor 2 family protein [Vicinamibacteria bacterium]
MKPQALGVALTIGLFAARPAVTASGGAGLADLQRQVTETERAFAKTMADRDHKAFVSFLAAETVFMGEVRTYRGKEQVAEGWKRYYEGPAAPFSWEPERVEVLDSGTLALSTGPVHDPKGQRVGTFSSIWRLEADGRWRIIFDKGCPPCKCP